MQNNQVKFLCKCKQEAFEKLLGVTKKIFLKPLKMLIVFIKNLRQCKRTRVVLAFKLNTSHSISANFSNHFVKSGGKILVRNVYFKKPFAFSLLVV